MQSNQINGKNSGKEPENPTVQIPEQLHKSLVFFRHDYSLSTAKKDLQNMLVLSLHDEGLGGQIHSEMAELTFDLIELIEAIYKHIPGEFDHLEIEDAA